jgi:hypothetical protein
MIKHLTGVLLFSIGFTSFLYWVDDDPPYADRWQTVREFIAWASVFFLLFGAIYFGGVKRKNPHTHKDPLPK